MFHTARSSARTLLVAAGTAGFVALGAGIAGADTLGGVTDGLPLGDLGSQVPTALTEGITTPVGDLVKVQPGEISAQPDFQHQTAEVQHQSDPVGSIVGDTVSTDALSTDTPLQTGEDNAANVGPLDLKGATGGLPAETLPLSDTGGAVDPLSTLLGGADLLGGGTGLLDSLPLGGGTLPMSAPASPVSLERGAAALDDTGGAVDPLSTLLGGADLLGGGTGLLDSLPLGGGTLPMSAPASPVSLERGAAVVNDTVTELGNRAGAGLHEPGLDLVGLDDLDAAQLGETVPMSDPLGLDAAENADLTGGVTTLLPRDVQETLPMSGPGDLEAPGAAQDAVSGTVGDLGDAVGGLGAEGTLPLSGAETDLVTGLLPETPGGDLVDVQGLPELGEPEVATLPLAEELPTEILPVELPGAAEQPFGPALVG